MKYRLVTLIGFVIAVTAIAVTSSRITFRYPPAVHETLVPRASSYLGVFESGPTPGSLPDYRSIEGFADMAGQTPNLAGYYSGWAEPFKTAFATDLHKHGVIPYVQIDPSFAKVAAIADGSQDTYLKGYADSVRDFGHPVVIGFGHEMNGTWYSWGFKSTKPAAFVAAWRHVVTLFRTLGAKNVTWLWTVNIINDTRTGQIPRPTPWWPGGSYVNWVGIDGYYLKPNWKFAPLFGPTIAAVRQLTTAPILIAETGAVQTADQPAKISDLFTGIRQYGLLGFVWFDSVNSSHQNFRIDSQSAITAFRRGASSYTRPDS